MITEAVHEAAEFRKRAETVADAERLSHEAAVLAVARHPGVVQLLGFDGATLRLRLVDGAPPADLAPLAAAVATTVADLHDIGVAHGALQGEHILMDGAGNAVLCGFGSGCIGVRPDGPEAAGDVAALAEVLGAGTADPDQRKALARRARSARQLALRLTPPAPPDPAQRRRGTRPERRGLGAPDPAQRRRATRPKRRQAIPQRPARPPTLRPAEPGPAGGRPASRARTRHTEGERPTTRAGAGLLLTALLVAAVAGAVGLIGARGGGPAGTACPAVDRGCRPLPRPGGLIAVAAGRYRVGRPGDVVVIGRWACRVAVPALLDPTTGEIWVWDRWASPGLPEPARPVARVAGAASMSVLPGHSGCDRLSVTRRPGGDAVVDPSPAHARLAPWPGSPG